MQAFSGFSAMMGPMVRFPMCVKNTNVEFCKRELIKDIKEKYGENEADILTAMVPNMCNYTVEIFLNLLDNGLQYLKECLRDGKHPDLSNAESTTTNETCRACCITYDNLHEACNDPIFMQSILETESKQKASLNSYLSDPASKQRYDFLKFMTNNFNSDDVARVLTKPRP